MKNIPEYQTLYIKLTSGKEISAVIPACLEPGEDLMVESIRVTEKKPLPKGCVFTELHGEE